jgi:hypothetical protein
VSEEAIHEGGCLCGGVRYRITGTIPPAVHCHCSMCRRGSGGTVVTWVSVPLNRLRFTDGEPKVYPSSGHGRRSFCPTCGAQLTFYSNNDPEFIDVTVVSLDAPENHPPDRHNWTSGRLPWLHVDEHLPQYPEWTPPDHRW